MKNLVPKFVPLDLEATRTWDLEANRDETSRQPARTSRQPAMILIGNELYHTPGSKEEEPVERYPPLLPGVCYSSFPIIAACLEVRAGCLEVRIGCLEVSSRIASRSKGAGRLEVPGNKLCAKRVLAVRRE